MSSSNYLVVASARGEEDRIGLLLDLLIEKQNTLIILTATLFKMLNLDWNVPIH